MALIPKQESEDVLRAQKMVEEIANNISSLSEAVSSLLSGRLKEKTIIILLAHATKMQQYQVEAVLQALKDMGKTHLK